MNKNNIISIDHLNPKNKDVLAVNWLLTNLCNYRCSYCSEEIHDGSITPLEIEKILNFCTNLIQNAKSKNKEVFFEFNGGEVTYFPKIERLIDHIYDNGAKVGVITNGSRPLKWWQSIGHKIDSVLLSFHLEFANLDKFIEVIKFLEKDSNRKVHLNVMIIPGRFEECYKAAVKIKKQSLASISLQRLLENHTTENDTLYPYTDEEKRRMIEFKTKRYLKRSVKKVISYVLGDKAYEARGKMLKTLEDKSSKPVSTDELVTSGQSRFKNWECMAGVENLAIDWHGNITRGQCGVGGMLGNIKDEDLNLDIKPIICNRDFCYCGFDLLCTKNKITIEG